jgi:hypothetical protein
MLLDDRTVKFVLFHFKRILILASLLIFSLSIGCQSPATTEPLADESQALPEPKYRAKVTITYTRDTSKIVDESFAHEPIPCYVRAYDPKAPLTQYGRFSIEEVSLKEIAPNLFQGTAHDILIQDNYYKSDHRLDFSDHVVGHSVFAIENIEVEGAYDMEYRILTWSEGSPNRALFFKMSEE